MPPSRPAPTARIAYDLVAADYARLLPDTAAEAAADREVLGRFSAAVPDHGPILDAGCGTGRLLGHLRDLGHHDLAGVDFSPGMIDQARRGHPGASFTVAELAGLPYPANSFEGVLAWYSIIHTAPEELGAVFGQFLRVLRPGGSLLLGFQSGSGRREIRRAYGRDVKMTAYMHDPADLVTRLGALGFVIDEDLQRAPRDHESSPQGFLRAHRR
ncbi:MAG: class I SAM-dependent methyltransferase [Micrococcaceae bacterium]|nr:class I SAM-dependent methyltransferase [Micrococcaceae bacterium]